MHESLDRPLPPLDAEGGEPYYVPPPLPPRHRLRRHVVLFVLTVLTTTVVGIDHYWNFARGFGTGPIVLPDWRDVTLYLHGLWYSVTVLGILGCHEMGHYIACRYYRVDASLPYFLPAPLPLTGTLGAVIRIRDRIPSKIALFDIGIAGPIAGFLVAVPALALGLALSTVVELPPDFHQRDHFELGEPLLFQGLAWLVFGDVPSGFTINMHPVAFAAWFGFLATALNLFPISQLDGGHVAYAVFGRRSTLITVAMVCVAIVLAILSTSWIVWTIMVVLMVGIMGPHHPPTLNDEAVLDRTRLILAVVALVIFVMCFTPAPLSFVSGQ